MGRGQGGFNRLHVLRGDKGSLDDLFIYAIPGMCFRLTHYSKFRLVLEMLGIVRKNCLNSKHANSCFKNAVLIF